MEQISLFEDEFVLINDAMASLKAMRPDDALESLKKYRDLYHGSADQSGKFEIATFLKERLSAAPPSGPDRPSYLFRL
jgi:hypothetical protein